MYCWASWADYIGVHCLGGKKPPLEIRQVGIHNPNLPYLEISQYTLTHITGLQSYMIHQGIPQPLASPNSGVPQFGSFQSQSTIQPNIHWANQQVITFLKRFARHNLKCANPDFALNLFSFRKYKMSHSHKMKQTINHPNQTRLHYSQVLIILMSCPLSQVRLAIQIILMPMGNNSRVLLVCLQN